MWILGIRPHPARGPAGVAAAALAEGPLRFVHIADPAAAAGEISGRYHPKATVPTRAGPITCPAFLADSRRLILLSALRRRAECRRSGAGSCSRARRAFLIGAERLFSLGRAAGAPTSRGIRCDPLVPRRSAPCRQSGTRCRRFEGRPVLPVFLWDEAAMGARAPGAAARWWLHHSLASRAIAAHGAVLHGPQLARQEILPRLLTAGNRGERGARHARLRTLGAGADQNRCTGHWAGRWCCTDRPSCERICCAAAAAGPMQSIPLCPRPFRRRRAPPPCRHQRAPALPLRRAARRLVCCRPVPGQTFPRWTPGEAGAADRLAQPRQHPRPLRGAAQHAGGGRHLPACRRICASGRSARGRSGTRRALPAPVASTASSRNPRASSPTGCCGTARMTEEPLRPEFRAFPWARDAALLRAWRKAAPATPSWMPAYASCAGQRLDAQPCG